ncbi:MAG: UbiD family decarboxylase, partial [Deferrisomatales bacterium]|nr:UbiD family decarboxylase [Deferrisomatales bacterium]
MVEFNDMREWLALADGIGELKNIEGADAHLEAGTMVQVNGQNMGPALLFDKFPGYQEGFRVLTNSMANIKTVNLTFGLPTTQ